MTIVENFNPFYNRSFSSFSSCKAARTYEALDQAMSEAVNVITEDDAIGWFNHCGLFT